MTNYNFIRWFRFFRCFFKTDLLTSCTMYIPAKKNHTTFQSMMMYAFEYWLSISFRMIEKCRRRRDGVMAFWLSVLKVYGENLAYVTCRRPSIQLRFFEREFMANVRYFIDCCFLKNCDCSFCILKIICVICRTFIWKKSQKLAAIKCNYYSFWWKIKLIT